MKRRNRFGGDISKLLETLDPYDSSKRKQGEDGLRKMAKQSPEELASCIPGLIELIHEMGAGRREEGAEALPIMSELFPKELAPATPSIFKLLAQEAYYLQEYAAQALLNIGRERAYQHGAKEAFRRFIERLNSKHAGKRMCCARGLGFIVEGFPDEVGRAALKLIELLEYGKQDIREAAQKTLDILGKRGQLQGLERQLIELNGLIDAGKYQEALAASDSAIRINPHHAHSWNLKGVILTKLGRYEEALEALEEAIRLDPLLDSAWHNKGIALSGLGRKKEALEAYQEAIRLFPQDALALICHGRTLRELGRYREALKSLNRAEELLTLGMNVLGDRDCRFERGWTLCELGRCEAALVEFGEIIAEIPADFQAWEGKARCLEKLGRRFEALEAWAEAVRLNPEESSYKAKRDELAQQLETAPWPVTALRQSLLDDFLARTIEKNTFYPEEPAKIRASSAEVETQSAGDWIWVKAKLNCEGKKWFPHTDSFSGDAVWASEEHHWVGLRSSLPNPPTAENLNQWAQLKCLDAGWGYGGSRVTALDPRGRVNIEELPHWGDVKMRYAFDLIQGIGPLTPAGVEQAPAKRAREIADRMAQMGQRILSDLGPLSPKQPPRIKTIALAPGQREIASVVSLGRFHLDSPQQVEEVMGRIRKAFLHYDIRTPIAPAGPDPRCRIIVADRETQLNHEWQVGTVESALFLETRDLSLPQKVAAYFPEEFVKEQKIDLGMVWFGALQPLGDARISYYDWPEWEAARRATDWPSLERQFNCLFLAMSDPGSFQACFAQRKSLVDNMANALTHLSKQKVRSSVYRNLLEWVMEGRAKWRKRQVPFWDG